MYTSPSPAPLLWDDTGCRVCFLAWTTHLISLDHLPTQKHRLFPAFYDFFLFGNKRLWPEWGSWLGTNIILPRFEEYRYFLPWAACVFAVLLHLFGAFKSCSSLCFFLFWFSVKYKTCIGFKEGWKSFWLGGFFGSCDWHQGWNRSTTCCRARCLLSTYYLLRLLLPRLDTKLVSSLFL